MTVSMSTYSDNSISSIHANEWRFPW